MENVFLIYAAIRVMSMNFHVWRGGKNPDGGKAGVTEENEMLQDLPVFFLG